MAQLRGIVFDIDDTLYLERDYVRSGFWAVADFLAKRGYFSARHIFDFLWRSFQKGVRGNAFDFLLENLPCLVEEVTVQELIQVYRKHIPNIEILPELMNTLRWLKHLQFFLGVISDGQYHSQATKASALGLKTIFDSVVLTDAWGKEFWKPNPRAFAFLEKEFGLISEQLLYVGDNPKKDFIAPNQRGWWTVRLKIPGQLYFEEKADQSGADAKYSAFSAQELNKFIERVFRQTRPHIPEGSI